MTELLKSLILPSNLAILCFLLGIAFMASRRFRHLSWPALILCGTVLTVFSSGKVAALLLSPLEYRYPQVSDPSGYPEARTIVVLTGYAARDPLIPLSSQGNSATVYRVLEAYRLYRESAARKIIISGNGPATEVMKQLLVTLGVPAQRIIEDENASHTWLSASHLSEKLDGRQFFLVTSAGHMPRALGVFSGDGMEPVPAPTDYLLPKDIARVPWLPSSHHLYFCDLAVGEYAGILWYMLRGRIEEN